MWNWFRPADYEAKVHVDGGLSRDGSRGASSVVYRDKHGNFLWGIGNGSLWACQLAILEARAYSKAVTLATDLHV